MPRWGGGGRVLLRRHSEVEKAAAVMPGRSARTAAPVVAAAALTFDDTLDEGLPVPISPVPSAAALSVMEGGGGGGGEIEQQRHDDRHHHHQQQQQHQQQQDSTPRVLVAAAEARDQEGEQRQRQARNYRCLAELFSILLLGLVAAFASIFVYAWVDAFNEGEFNQALGLITLLFFGTTVCAWASRRRLALTTQLHEERFMELSTPLPKGVPPHVRRNYHYFTFDGATKSETNTSTESSVLSFRSQQRTPESQAAGGRGRKICGDSVPTTGGVADEGGDKCAAMGRALPPESKEDGQRERGKRWGGCIDEEKEQEGHHHHQQLASCSWAPSVLTECSVCLEGYRGGDRMCRLPCAHAFHAACIDAWLDLHHKCPQCRLDLLTSDIDWETRPENSASEHPAVLAAAYSPREAESVPLPVPSQPPAVNNTSADTIAANISPDAPGRSRNNSWYSPPRANAKTRVQLSPRSWREVDRASIAQITVAATATNAMGTTKTPGRTSTWAVTAPNGDGSGNARPVHYPSRGTEPVELRPSVAERIAGAPKQPAATTSYTDFCDSPKGTTSLSSAAVTAKGQRLPGPRGVAPCSTTTARSPKAAPCDSNIDCDRFAAVTEYNTAVNATASARWPETAAAPYACFIGSPYTPSPPAGTSMIKYLDSPSEAGEEEVLWATDRVDDARMAQPRAGPYASYIDSVCAFSPSPRGEAMARVQNASPESAPYAGNLRWPFSPQQSSLSDGDMVGPSDYGEEFSWKTGRVGAKTPQPPQAAPYARYLDSPCTPSPIAETVMVRTRGASTPAPAYSFSNSACPPSPALSGASGVKFTLSQEFGRVARSRGGSRALAGMVDSAFSMSSPPVRSYPSLPLSRQFSREFDPPSTAGSHVVVGTPRSRQWDDPRDRRGGGQTRLPESTSQIQSQPQAGFTRFTHEALDDGAAPPPPPPRLVSRRPPTVRQSRFGGRPPPAAQPRGSSFSNGYGYGGGRNGGGGGRGTGAPSRSSAGLLVLGNASANPAVAGEGVGKGWEWPLRASMWGNNAWPAAGGRVHIEPLDKEGEGGLAGEGRRREEEGHSSTDARWAREHGMQGDVKQQQRRQHEQRRLHQQFLQQQFARSFDEESIAETEEDDDQLWDRVQYWFQV